MARVEADHWWYRGLRDAIATALRSRPMGLPVAPRVLDAGCGTGANLHFLAELLQPSYLGGFDASAEAVAIAREKAPGADVYCGDICAPELHTDSLDVITSLDVVYIPGARRAMGGLQELVARLRPGGLLVLNLPAYDWLFSEHDLAIHTHERYTAKRVRALLEELGLSVELLTYRLCFLFPVVVGMRLPSMWRARHRRDGGARSDLHSVPGSLANRLLYASLRLENRLMAGGVRLPWGSSVFAVGRKVAPDAERMS